MEYEHVVHSFEPVYNTDSKILILGTLPSVKSRENHFYYGHKQNRFWKLLARICEEDVPETIEEKKAMLLRNHIAIWDVIYSCDIQGSSDSSIKNVVPTDLKQVLANSSITQIYANGNKAGSLYKKYQQANTNMNITVLPSTSPANAAWSLDRLYDTWSVIKTELSL
nr:DNA-deoxyinosine glycosylase [uncultured Mediterraneibacter sp.]